MDFATNSINVEQVTPEKAAEYLRCNYARNRKMRRGHVMYLVNEMRCGRFMPTAEIHLMFRNGDPIMVNGQHTCSAIIEYGKPVSVTLRKTIVRDSGQIALFYGFGHDSGLKRTVNDAVSAYDIAGITKLGSQQSQALISALRHIKLGFVGESGSDPRAHPADLIDYAYDWAAEAKILFDAIANCDQRINILMKKRAALSVAIVTIHYQHDKAVDFWRGVAMPDHLAWDDPRMIARRKLEESRRTAGVTPVKPALLSRQLARCWNAYFKNEEIKIIKIIDKTAPIVIHGTPYNGKQPSDFLSIKNELTAAASKQ